MKTSGLVLDLYDDADGTVLRSFYPTPADLPEVVKTASALTSDDLSALPDDLFALVIHDGDRMLRKYACYDAGNTALSVMYFLSMAHKLPDTMQKVAAANLLKACDWYGLEVPGDLEKIASGMFEKVAIGINTMMGLAAAPSIVKGTSAEIKMNRDATRAAQMATGNPVVTPEQVRHFKGAHVKQADVTGTHLMPLQEPSEPQPKKQYVPKKTAAAEANFTSNVVRAKRQEVLPDANYTVKTEKEEEPQKEPQAAQPKTAGRLIPHVEAGGQPPRLRIEKYAHRLALGDKYPLDSYAQVKAASAYFDEYGRRFSPAERHEYCMNLVKRASELGIEVSEEARKYGSATYAPQHEFDMAMAIRHNALSDDHAHSLLDKLAECRPGLEPDLFCSTLEEFDKVAGIQHLWDSHVFDPYFSTYGFTKTAEEEDQESFVDNIGNHRVTASQLKHAALTQRKALADLFGEDFADEFKKDPIGIYKSMPREQKIVIMNLAQDAESSEVR